MLFIAYAYKELNSKDPDCGTTFTWGARAFGPRTGWFGGWGIVAADMLVMASLAQIAGQYVFLLFNTAAIGSNASSGWVLLVGIAWIVVMTVICYVGHRDLGELPEDPARHRAHDARRSCRSWALVKVGNGTAPIGHLAISWTLVQPVQDLHAVGVHQRARC